MYAFGALEPMVTAVATDASLEYIVPESRRTLEYVLPRLRDDWMWARHFVLQSPWGLLSPWTLEHIVP